MSSDVPEPRRWVTHRYGDQTVIHAEGLGTRLFDLHGRQVGGCCPQPTPPPPPGDEP